MTIFAEYAELFNYLDYLRDLDAEVDFVVALQQTFNLNEDEAQEVIDIWKGE